MPYEYENHDKKYSEFPHLKPNSPSLLLVIQQQRMSKEKLGWSILQL